jgi:glutathione S-transferase
LPAIEEDGKTIMDSWKVAEYLETQYPDTPTLFPGTSKPLARLIYPFFMTQIASPVFPLLLPKVVDFLDDRGAAYFKETREESFGEPISHDIYKDTERVEKIWKSVDRNLKLMEITLTDVEGPYMLGHERSYADLLVASVMGWYKVVSPDMYDRMVAVAPALGRLHDKCMELLN